MRRNWRLFIQPDTAIKTNRNGSRRRITSEVTLSPPSAAVTSISRRIRQIEFSDPTAFDLETNQRIAEFKFIRWRGGPEVIRQNSLFKDFYEMAEYATKKRKYLYVLGTKHPEKFFNSGRALSSVLSRHVKLRDEFAKKYGDQCQRVRDYYVPRKDDVIIRTYHHSSQNLSPRRLRQTICDRGPLRRLVTATPQNPTAPL